MKVLFIRPPIHFSSLDYPSGPKFGIPVGLLYLAAVCEKAGHEVVIYDAMTDFRWENLEKTDGHYHIGATWSEIARYVKECAPDAVGISNPFSDYMEYALLCADSVRKTLPNIPIWVGGPHATSAPESFLFPDSPFNLASRGEGELTVPLLLEHLEKGIPFYDVPGISFRKDGKIVHNEVAAFVQELDELPLPSYHLIDMERYIGFVKEGYPSRFTFEYRGAEREMSLITSRGCPYKCVFCGNFQHMGRKWRYHSSENIREHMKHCIEQFQIKHFHIEDDNLSLNPTRFESFLDMIIESGWDITWDTPNGIRAEGFTPEIVEKIVASGCTYLIVGVESGSQRVVKEVVRKSLNLEKVVEAARLCAKYKVSLHAFFIIGFPGETADEVSETIDFALMLLKKYNVIPHMGIARPLPGTEMYEICEREGWLTDPIVPDIGKGVRSEVFERRMIETPEFKPEYLEQRLGEFSKKVMITIAMKTAVWFLIHPVKGIAVTRYFFFGRKERLAVKVKRLFFGGMFYRENYSRRLP